MSVRQRAILAAAVVFIMAATTAKAQYVATAPTVAPGTWTYAPPAVQGTAPVYVAPRTYSSYYYPYTPSYRTIPRYPYRVRRPWRSYSAPQEYYWPTGRDVPLAKPWLTP
jgi:hypothetical protein